MKPYIHSLNSLLIFTFCESGITELSGCSDHFMWCFKNRVKMEIHSFGCLLALIPDLCPLSFHLQPVTPNQRVHILGEGRLLQIQPTQVSDSGRYLCVATNVAGEDDQDFNVLIQGAWGYGEGVSGTWGASVLLGRPGRRALFSSLSAHLAPLNAGLGSFMN